MHHFVTEMCTHANISDAKWSIMGYCTDAVWDLWNGSIPGLHRANERCGYKVTPFPIGCVEHGSTWIQTVGVIPKPNYSNKKYAYYYEICCQLYFVKAWYIVKGTPRKKMWLKAKNIPFANWMSMSCTQSDRYVCWKRLLRGACVYPAGLSACLYTSAGQITLLYVMCQQESHLHMLWIDPLTVSQHTQHDWGWYHCEKMNRWETYFCLICIEYCLHLQEC